MKENDCKEEALNAEEPALSKEEILTRSRKENKKSGDEREQGLRLWARNIGFMITVLACAVVLTVKVITEDAVPYEIMAVMLTGLAAQNAAELFITANKKMLTLSIVTEVVVLAAAILYWVEWCISLAGK